MHDGGRIACEHRHSAVVDLLLLQLLPLAIPLLPLPLAMLLLHLQLLGVDDVGEVLRFGQQAFIDLNIGPRGSSMDLHRHRNPDPTGTAHR